ncbi:MAG: hypothetical protein ACK46Z_01485, partial [Bacteroidota bacterium]
LITEYDHNYEKIPVSKIKWLLYHTLASLKIVHNEKNHSVHRELQEIVLLKDHQPSYHVVHHASFTDGVTDFVEQHQSDWVIVIPKDHGFFSSLFATSHTTRLAFHSRIPLLAIHA